MQDAKRCHGKSREHQQQASLVQYAPVECGLVQAIAELKSLWRSDRDKWSDMPGQCHRQRCSGFDPENPVDPHRVYSEINKIKKINQMRLRAEGCEEMREMSLSSPTLSFHLPKEAGGADKRGMDLSAATAGAWRPPGPIQCKRRFKERDRGFSIFHHQTPLL